ncbi:unnamed protein product [Cylicocyclus nassatus]|uniref:Uncharacterized protein n=1 Tax=Cylicocyclus nassatus TaxID=53992 RepID=A0AA36GT22_CYLNA|nr:unnamed protein product [Cylicocyclus nassatus]
MYSLNSSTSSSTVLTLFVVIGCFVASSPDGHNPHRLNEESNKKFSKDRRQQRIEETEKLVLKKLLSKPKRKIDEFCSELDGTCFIITDKILRYGNMPFAYRDMGWKWPENVLSLSRTRLQPYSPLNWKNFNSRTWGIRKDDVLLTYARLMIAGAFLSGGLELNTTRKQDVLIIGLGGGVINNYFSQMEDQVLNVTVVEIDPVMKKVAIKWFGFVESPLHRIVVDDGVRYIHDAAKRGEKYDALIIDVSYNMPLPMIAPIKEFLEDDLIVSMRTITTGGVIVNIVTRRGHSQEAGKALFRYSRHFPSCYFMNYQKNKMLFCSTKDNNLYSNNTDEVFRDSFMTVDNALGFRLFSKVYPSLD